jgi:hypothetical protein
VKAARGAGARVVSSGILYRDTEGITFEVSDGKASVKHDFETAAKTANAAMSVLITRAESLVSVEETDAVSEAPATPAPSAPPTAPAPPAGAAVAPAPQTTALRETLMKMLPTVKNAIAAHPERRTELTEAATRCQEHVKNDKPEEARAALLQLGQLLKEVTAVPAAPPPAPPPPPAPSAGKSLATMVREGLMKLLPAVQNAIDAHPERRTELTTAATRCQDHLTHDRPDEARAAVLQLSQLLKEVNAVPAAAPASPAGTAASPTVESAAPSPANGRQAWERESRKARYQIRRLQVAMLRVGHPRAVGVVKRLDTIVNKLVNVPKTPSAADQLRKYLETDKLVAAAESPNPAGIPIPLSSGPLLKALEQLKGELTA